MMWRIVICALAAFTVAACQREADEHIAELSGRVFVFNYRIAKANYLVTLRRTAPVPDGAYAEAEFENPSGGAPLTVREKLFPVMDKIVLESPEIRCVRKDRPYAVKIRLVGADGNLLQGIETSITSTLDQEEVMPSKPLVVGPLYSPNPEVFRPDGNVEFGEANKCPA